MLSTTTKNFEKMFFPQNMPQIKIIKEMPPAGITRMAITDSAKFSMKQQILKKT